MTVKATKTTRRPARPRKTDEERTAELTAIKATLDAAVKTLAESPDQWVEFLTTVSQFAARYSANNQLLIMAQCHSRGFQPTMVRPYGTRDKATGKARSGWAGGWLTLGRNVTKGQTGLKIYRPVLKRMTEEEAAAKGGNVRRDAKGRLPERIVGWALASVFDITQTEGDDVEVPAPLTISRKVRAPGGAMPELLTGEDTTGALDGIVKMIKDAGYSFDTVDPAELGGANGQTDGAAKRVTVRNDVEPLQILKTTVHELAHILCGHLDPSYAYSAHRGRAETEAESSAYVVLSALGVDSGGYSAPYVSSWAGTDMAMVSATAQTVVKVARKILAGIEAAEEPTDVELAA